jgi:uncharacterized protein YjbI with pentapeptide repeats
MESGMKLLFAALAIFPASWVAVPRTPPRLIITTPPAEYYFGCASVGGRTLGRAAWKTAKQVRGVREAADLDRIGKGDFVVVDAQLRGQRLAGHRLSGLCFDGGDLTQTDWRGVTARDMGFHRSDLSGATMTGTALRRTTFYETRLDRVDAAKAHLSGSRIEGGSFDGLVLRGAKLRGFGVSCGMISGEHNCEWPEKRGVDARGADLTEAAFDIYRTKAWRFEGAVLDRTTVQFNQAESFRSAAVRGPVMLANSGYSEEAKVRLDRSEWRDLLAALWTERPSFDCARARTVVERSICAPDTGLDARDRQLAALFDAVRADGKTTRAEQRRWLRSRDACAGRPEGWEREVCISSAYGDRIDALMRRGAHPRWIRPGARRVFVSNHVVPPVAFQRTRLYERIFPVLLASASTWVYVHARDRHVVVANGDAIGSNGHLCDLAEGAYALDAHSGWFGAPRSADYRKFFPDAPAFEALLRFAGDDAVVGPREAQRNEGEYVSCGARAGFDSLSAIRVPPAQRNALAKRAPGFFKPDI